MRPSDDPRATDDLVREAMRMYGPDVPEADREAVPARDALILRCRREDLDAGLRLCRSTSPAERSLGAQIVGEFGYDAALFVDERFNALEAALAVESESEVMAQILFGLRHLHDVRALAPLVKHSTHPSAEVRFAIAWGLGNFLGESEQREDLQRREEAVDNLLTLLADVDGDVRDAAVCQFALNEEVDSPDVRETLRARLTDPHDLAREESMLALARRHDETVAPFIMTTLSHPQVGTEALRAAALLGDPDFYPALEALYHRWEHEPRDHFNDLLDQAMQNCRPSDQV